jgi:hypothetical protein
MPLSPRTNCAAFSFRTCSGVGLQCGCARFSGATPRFDGVARHLAITDGSAHRCLSCRKWTNLSTLQPKARPTRPTSRTGHDSLSIDSIGAANNAQRQEFQRHHRPRTGHLPPPTLYVATRSKSRRSTNHTQHQRHGRPKLKPFDEHRSKSRSTTAVDKHGKDRRAATTTATTVAVPSALARIARDVVV